MGREEWVDAVVPPPSPFNPREGCGRGDSRYRRLSSKQRKKRPWGEGEKGKDLTLGRGREMVRGTPYPLDIILAPIKSWGRISKKKVVMYKTLESTTRAPNVAYRKPPTTQKKDSPRNFYCNL